MAGPRALQTFDLGARGLAHLRQYLFGVNSLCSALSEILETGRIFTTAPPDTPLERLYEFESGGLLPENLNPTDVTRLEDGSTLAPIISLTDEHITLLHQTMQSAPGSILIVEDHVARWLEDRERVEPSAFGVDNEVYHLVSSDASPDEIDDVLRIAHLPWHGVEAVCTTPLTLSAQRECTPDALRRTALSAMLFTCSAYDGEGYLAWRKRG
jgi:hypothetical protein